MLSLELFVDAPEEVVPVVKGLCLVTREGELWVVTRQRLLVEHGLVATDEREVRGLDDLESEFR